MPGGAANVQDIYPLAPLQEGILFHHLMAARGRPVPAVARCCASTTASGWTRYLRALQAVIDRHDILRTAVLWEGLPSRCRWCGGTAPLPVEEVELDPAGDDAAAQLHARFDPRRYRLDLRQAPLLRALRRARPPAERWLLLLLLPPPRRSTTRRWRLLQRGGRRRTSLGRATGRCRAPLPFRNFVAQARLGREPRRSTRRSSADAAATSTSRPRRSGCSTCTATGAASREARPSARRGAGARGCARRRGPLGVSAASLCHVAWAQVLARATGRDDVVFGTVLFGRMQGGEGADRVLGLFINTLPVRLAAGDAGRCSDCVRRTHARWPTCCATSTRRWRWRSGAARCAPRRRCSPRCSTTGTPRCSPSADRRAPDAAGTRLSCLTAQERTNYPLALSVDDLGDGFG